MEGIHEDTGDSSMQCTEHPFKNNTPAGGICAICLQEKLGKLVSSSFPIAVFPSSSSSSPSFRSDIGGVTTTTTTATIATVSSAAPPPRFTNSTNLLSSTTQITRSNSTKCHHHHYSNRSRLLYLIGQRKKKKKDLNIVIDHHDRTNNLVFKRSKSTADGLCYNDLDNMNMNNSTHKRGFWSFIHLQKHHHSTSSNSKTLRNISSNTISASARSQRNSETIIMEDNETASQPSYDRKVSRSRSVGCGSRSFSGDFFERISTGFGDCTLRRVESQREGRSRVSAVGGGGQDGIKERVRCGGLFSGFMITSSSSSSSSSSYWVASNPRESSNGTGRVTSAVAGKERSWGWALASPMRAFSKPSSSKREGSNKNSSPNLSAIPSLLSVRS